VRLSRIPTFLKVPLLRHVRNRLFPQRHSFRKHRRDLSRVQKTLSRTPVSVPIHHSQRVGGGSPSALCIESPDKNPGVKGAHERFARLGVIASILKDEEKRERYIYDGSCHDSLYSSMDILFMQISVFLH
jgi:hypothetical protein